MGKGTFYIETPAADAVVQPRGPGGHRHKVWWTTDLRKRFLDHLSITCDVTASARAIDVGPQSCYALRRRDPAFAAAWQDALALGYQTLETRLMAMAMNSAAEDAYGPLDCDLAKWLMREQREREQGHPRRKGGPPLKQVSAEETDRAILSKLANIEARKRAA
jgi:hypothetical protein